MIPVEAAHKVNQLYDDHEVRFSSKSNMLGIGTAVCRDRRRLPLLENVRLAALLDSLLDQRVYPKPFEEALL